VSEATEGRWLLLIHQIRPKPDGLRVKIWRRLQRLGAVAIKNSVYVLPKSDSTQEDFQWVLREIVEDGGDASICEARFLEGIGDEQIEMMFNTARDADYAQLLEDAREVAKEVPRKAVLDEVTRGGLEADVARLEKRLAEITSIDFFGAPGRDAAAGQIKILEERLASKEEKATKPAEGGPNLGKLSGRLWVTRKGIHVDRMACAWLIRRFIDPKATFKFVQGKGYRPEPGELRFDMFEAEFTHEGDRCSFEVLLLRVGLEDRALRAIGEIVHDIDLKDGKFAREETGGIKNLIAGIAMAQREDEARMAQSQTVFDNLYEYFKKRRASE
jgi:hypothetical protein